jgi:hypothetical protein
MERDPNDVNPNWERPSDWKYKADWDSPNWKRWRHETSIKIQKMLEKYGFALCPSCGAQHTALTFMCRKCSYKVVVPKDEMIPSEAYRLEVIK